MASNNEAALGMQPLLLSNVSPLNTPSPNLFSMISWSSELVDIDDSICSCSTCSPSKHAFWIGDCLMFVCESAVVVVNNVLTD